MRPRDCTEKNSPPVHMGPVDEKLASGAVASAISRHHSYINRGSTAVTK